MEENKNTANTSIGFCSLLAIVFITLKLLGKISWSWIWVLAPVWIPALLAVLVLFITLKLLGKIKRKGGEKCF